jgi:tRNA A-37 threonylcarbamoyl transferase component Bud32
MTDRSELHPSLADLEAFDQGRLEPASWSAIERHVGDCSECARTLAGLPEQGLADLLHDYGACAGAGNLPPGLAAHPHYVIRGVLGAGGMGTVYRAEHRLMGRPVVLKVIHPHLLARPEVVERFRQEMRAAARLAHPNIVTAYDAGEAEGACFLVLEYVEGETLDRVLARRGPLPVGEACAFARQAALGLQHAHERGLVHRDLKPGNVLLTPEGQVKILDFGLARLRPELRADDGLTPAGVVVGTPAYLAPEQARDPGSADARSDLYSLGCTLYHLLAGRPPFAEGTHLQQLLAHQDRAPEPLSAVRSDVPEALSRLVERLLAKEPARRCQTAAEVIEALTAFTDPAAAGLLVGGRQTGTIPPASPARLRLGQRFHQSIPVVAGLALAAAAGVGIWWLVTANRSPSIEREVDVNGSRAGKGSQANSGPPRRKYPELWSARPVVRDQVLAWLKADDRFGPDHPFPGQMARRMDEQLVGGRAFMLRLGPGVGYAGRPTLLAGRHHDLYAFELTKPQGRRWLEVPGMELIVSNPQSQEFAPLQQVRLSGLQVAGANTFDIHGRLRGSVGYEKLGRFSGTVAVRVTGMGLGPTRTVYRIYWDEALAEQGRLAFDLDPLIGKDDPVPRNPAVLFFELGLWRGQGHKRRMLVLSNTVAVPLLWRQTQSQVGKAPPPGE